jgi:hypothetical protein
MVIFRGCAVRPWSVVTRTRRRFSSSAFACVGYNCFLRSRKVPISACGSRLSLGRFPARGRVLHAPSPAIVSCKCLHSGFLFVFVSVCVCVCCIFLLVITVYRWVASSNQVFLVLWVEILHFCSLRHPSGSVSRLWALNLFLVPCL